MKKLAENLRIIRVELFSLELGLEFFDKLQITDSRKISRHIELYMSSVKSIERHMNNIKEEYGDIRLVDSPLLENTNANNPSEIQIHP